MPVSHSQFFSAYLVASNVPLFALLLMLYFESPDVPGVSSGYNVFLPGEDAFDLLYLHSFY